MELNALLDQLQSDGTLHRIATNVTSQFGTVRRSYVGATILPERLVTVNQYRETKISYRSVIANNGSRYSPAQKKNGKLVGHFDVILADSDIADDFTGADYDVLIQMLTPVVGPLNASMPAMDASDQIQRWIDAAISVPLIELNEKQRWEAMVNKSVQLHGDNGYEETIQYPAYADLSINAADWTDPTVDPLDDIFKIVTAMSSRGTSVSRIIMGLPAIILMMGNAKMKARTGNVVVVNGTLTGVNGLVDVSSLNTQLGRFGLPAIEQYDLQYRTQTGAGFFLPRDAMVFVGASDSEERIDLGDGQYETIEGTLGYQAVGRGVGRSAPGRFVLVETKNDKPPRIEAQGWQTSLPVITEPELIGVVKAINVPATSK